MVISTVRLFKDFLVLMNVWKILNKIHRKNFIIIKLFKFLLWFCGRFIFFGVWENSFLIKFMLLFCYHVLSDLLILLSFKIIVEIKEILTKRLGGWVAGWLCVKFTLIILYPFLELKKNCAWWSHAMLLTGI